jgi:transcription elongation factor S-II
VCDAAAVVKDEAALEEVVVEQPKRKGKKGGPAAKKDPHDSTTDAAAAAAAATTTMKQPQQPMQQQSPSPPTTPTPRHEVPQRAALIEFLEARCSNLGADQVLDAEVGVYNWALAQAEKRRIARNWRNSKFRALYESKARSVAANLDRSSYVANERLASRIAEREFFPHDVASMTPEHVFPERWREVVEMKVRRDEYISNNKPTAMTDQFRCKRCKGNECSYMELQTRSCDEPATLFIQCLTCGNRWRIG